MAVASCTKAPGIRNKYPLHQLQQKAEENVSDNGIKDTIQREGVSEVVSIPDGVRNIIIYRYIQYTFGKEVNDPNELGENPIMEAIRKGDEASVVILLEHPCIDVNSKNKHGYSALDEAVRNGKGTIVRALLEKGADVNGPQYVDPVLHTAAIFGIDTIVHILIDHGGAYVNEADEYGNTALHWASYHGHRKVVQILIEKGADVNAENRWRDTALHWAAKSEYRDIVALLTRAGAR